MPFQYNVDPYSRLAVLRASGMVTDDELLRLLGLVFAEPDVSAYGRAIWDLRGVETMAVTSAGVRRLVQLTNDRAPPRFRNAIVVTNELAFGMMRMYGLLEEAPERETRVFRGLSEALSWLSVDVEIFERAEPPRPEVRGDPNGSRPPA